MHLLGHTTIALVGCACALFLFEYALSTGHLSWAGLESLAAASVVLRARFTQRESLASLSSAQVFDVIHVDANGNFKSTFCIAVQLDALCRCDWEEVCVNVECMRGDGEGRDEDFGTGLGSSKAKKSVFVQSKNRWLAKGARRSSSMHAVRVQARQLLHGLVGTGGSNDWRARMSAADIGREQLEVRVLKQAQALAAEGLLAVRPAQWDCSSMEEAVALERVGTAYLNIYKT